jgi:glucose-1-phosphate adenylyltransferase
MIMAGGKGERLLPLTALRSKPSVPFGGHYRIIDFVLSNFVNSGMFALYVLVQYRSQSLIEHLRETWQIGGRLKSNFISIVPPQMKARGGWYEGTADAVYHNLNLIHDFAPDVIAVFGADHIYRMNIEQMLAHHIEKKADVTVAALPVPVGAATEFGILETESNGRIVGFEEKPMHPKPMPADGSHALSSMGNYLFRTDLLIHLLERDASRPGSHDFGRNIIPDLLAEHEVQAYDFLKNDVPGLQPHEERGYWRDVGTLEAYWQANMDLLGEQPAFDLRNAEWPILSRPYSGPMASLVRSRVHDSMVGHGSQCIEASIHRSIIGQGVHIGRGAELDECVILDGAQVGSGARLRRVIADRTSMVPATSEIGFDQARDRQRFHVSKTGLVVLPKPSTMGQELVRQAS